MSNLGRKVNLYFHYSKMDLKGTVGGESETRVFVYTEDGDSYAVRKDGSDNVDVTFNGRPLQ